jgi:glycosyltransferase involved in cell wall biosynthesis
MKRFKRLKPVILCFIPYYIPGYKYGGPIQTIKNFSHYLSGEFEICIVTRNRDFNKSLPYINIKSNDWNTIGQTKVFYISEKNIGFGSFYKLIKNSKCDLIYLNSLFDYKFTIIPLLIKLMGSFNSTPIIISPRGQLSKAALSFKKIKKFLFLRLAKFLNIYANLHWQASSMQEYQDIKREFCQIAKSIKIMPDLFDFKNTYQNNNYKRQSKLLSVVFLSRISPMKNLEFLINIFLKISNVVKFNIYGTIDDKKYWEKCQNILKKLPPNIKLNIGSEIPSKNVRNVLSKHDLFAFPTKGENFSHVILEALSVGTPVLVSDKTLWNSDKLKGLKTLPLDQNLWVREIKEWSRLTVNSKMKRRKAALAYCKKAEIQNLKSIISHKVFFKKIIKKNVF